MDALIARTAQPANADRVSCHRTDNRVNPQSALRLGADAASDPPSRRGVGFTGWKACLMPRIKASLRDPLNSPETHKAIAVRDHVHAAFMRELSPPALEGLRDEFEHMADERTGPRGELNRAWTAFTTQMLADARTRTRKGELALSPT
jgi:hypothetical protein